MSLSCVFVFSCFPVHFESINWFWTIVTKWQGPLQPALRASWKLLYSRSLLPWIDHVCPTRHCTQGLSSPYISMRSCCKGTCWSALCWPVLCTGGCYERGDSPGCQEMIPGSVCHTNKVHHSMRGREAEPVYWQDLHSTPWENPVQGLSNLKGRKIYSLSIFPFLFYCIKIILLCHLLLGFSYWNLERALHHLVLLPSQWHRTGS